MPPGRRESNYRPRRHSSLLRFQSRAVAEPIDRGGATLVPRPRTQLVESEGDCPGSSSISLKALARRAPWSSSSSSAGAAGGSLGSGMLRSYKLPQRTIRVFMRADQVVSWRVSNRTQMRLQCAR